MIEWFAEGGRAVRPMAVLVLGLSAALPACGKAKEADPLEKLDKLVKERPARPKPDFIQLECDKHFPDCYTGTVSADSEAGSVLYKYPVKWNEAGDSVDVTLWIIKHKTAEGAGSYCTGTACEGIASTYTVNAACVMANETACDKFKADPGAKASLKLWVNALAKTLRDGSWGS